MRGKERKREKFNYGNKKYFCHITIFFQKYEELLKKFFILLSNKKRRRRKIFNYSRHKKISEKEEKLLQFHIVCKTHTLK